MAVDVVKDYGEVLTPMNIVADMLNLLPDGTLNLDYKVLEPSVGTGNFLVEVIERKLAGIAEPSTSDIMRAYASVWGIDIQPRNIMICRQRLYDMHPIPEVKDILEHNIIVGDFLTEKMIKMNWDCHALNYKDNTDTGIELVSDGSDFPIASVLESTSPMSGDIDLRVLNPKTMQFETEPPEVDSTTLFSSFFSTLKKS